MGRSSTFGNGIASPELPDPGDETLSAVEPSRDTQRLLGGRDKTVFEDLIREENSGKGKVVCVSAIK